LHGPAKSGPGSLLPLVLYRGVCWPCRRLTLCWSCMTCAGSRLGLCWCGRFVTCGLSGILFLDRARHTALAHAAMRTCKSPGACYDMSPSACFTGARLASAVRRSGLLVIYIFTAVPHPLVRTCRHLQVDNNSHLCRSELLDILLGRKPL